jgi:hypothetical protein
MTYKISKTPARYNITGKDTYRVLYKAKTPVKYCSESWESATDNCFYSLEDAEACLEQIKKARDKVIYDI